VQPVDDKGFPGTIGEQGEFDGGDTAAILGTLLTFSEQGWAQRLYECCSLGTPRRHPDQTRWYGQPDRFSRDQLVPVICAGINYKVLYSVDLVYTENKKRHFLTAWNTKKNGAMDVPSKTPDFCGPTIWALWIRYKRPWWARLFLNILDLEGLCSSLHWKYFRKDRVTRNHMLVSIIANRHMPTIVSRLTYKINNWPDLIAKWDAHCEAVREYNTAQLFRDAIKYPNS
jgi:hypothetical protein